MPHITAHCCRRGIIRFSRRCPTGLLPLVAGPDDEVRSQVSARARHAYDGKTLLVPGVPEADGEKAALAAVERWLDWAFPDHGRGAARRPRLQKRAA
jgi:hypothetical protein